MLLLWGKVYAVHSIEQADPIQSFNKLEHRSWAENNKLDRRTDIFEVGKATVPAISPLHLGALPSGLAIDCTVRAARCTMGCVHPQWPYEGRVQCRSGRIHGQGLLLGSSPACRKTATTRRLPQQVRQSKAFDVATMQRRDGSGSDAAWGYYHLVLAMDNVPLYKAL